MFAWGQGCKVISCKGSWEKFLKWWKCPVLGWKWQLYCISKLSKFINAYPQNVSITLYEMYWNKFNFKIKSEIETETYSLYSLQSHCFLHQILTVTTALHAHPFPVICSWAVESDLSLGLISTPWRNKTGARLFIHSNPKGCVGWCATHLDGEWKGSRKTLLTRNTDYSNTLQARYNAKIFSSNPQKTPGRGRGWVDIAVSIYRGGTWASEK